MAALQLNLKSWPDYGPHCNVYLHRLEKLECSPHTNKLKVQSGKPVTQTEKTGNCRQLVMFRGLTKGADSYISHLEAGLQVETA